MAEQKKKTLFYLGLYLIIASIVFSVVTYYYAEEYPLDGVYRSQDKRAIIIRLIVGSIILMVVGIAMIMSGHKES